MKTRLQHFLMTGICCMLFTSYGWAQKASSTEFPNTSFCEITAELLNYDSVSHVHWNETWYTYYDDGSCDEMTLWAIAGGEMVNKFALSPSANLIGALIHVGDGSFPQGNEFLGTDFLLVAYDNDGVDGMPGTLLDSALVTVENYFWVRCEGLDLLDEDGILYLGMRQLGSSTTAAPIGIDNEQPTENISYARMPGSEAWQVSSYQDFMIRAITCDVSKQDALVKQRNEPNIVVARVSDFDPNLGETPEDGVLTVIDSILPYQEDYYDMGLALATSGYYAYALKRFEDESATYGDWNYSNLVYHVYSFLEEETKQQMKIYPNPANDKIWVEFGPEEKGVVMVNDLSGRTFYQSIIPLSRALTIEVSQWPKGMYLIFITDEGEVRKPVKLLVE